MFQFVFMISAIIPMGFGVLVVVEIGSELILAGSSVTLFCRYDLEGEKLNSVKWYREQSEFFRYIPEQIPPIVVFQHPGINVDVPGSGADQVTLQNIGQSIEGKFICEVSAEGPTFNTGFDSVLLNVKDIHIRKPLLLMSSSVYHPGSDLNVQCSAQVTEPPPKIVFLINDVVVEKKWVKIKAAGISELLPEVFIESLSEDPESKNPVWVRCEASLMGSYRLTSASVPIVLQHFAPKSDTVRYKPMEPIVIFVLFSLLAIWKLL